ncbi:aldehyde:ferredoxin oxidoreductase [Desulfobaculum xiamenense]|uniref:Aldehyde:ferredoxin oxidoreductase n=1 Tax=Desulfobaculum xiamenense TaxID=995050 RepID=A0A846QPJ1_9BACT|nr:aldehyde ferredoxin oxidoreductase N-terminal domain-containing protein [Desulfobaculum xiamenense]NJB68412.1 aldehyde:ferredoxin oxidoreductase [Desulfobaculum xiamenense]
MIQKSSTFRVLRVHLDTGVAEATLFDGRREHLGGSGLAAALFGAYGAAGLPAGHPEQPVIFAIGPLTGLFPLMSKVVCGFMSPYHGQYTESHAGGRLGMALARSGWDALVFTGVAPGTSVACVDCGGVALWPAPELRGRDVFSTLDAMHERLGDRAARASMCCIGPAAENGCTYGCVTVDTHRHFGRLGAGTALASKGLKAFAVLGDGRIERPKSASYRALVAELAKAAATSPLMGKYRNPGTAGIVESINALGALPWRNLEDSADTGAERITGEALMKTVFVGKAACSGCTAACIHLARVERPFCAAPADPDRISYDYEHIFALGSMLGVTDPHDVMGLILCVERQGLDIMSCGVSLAWATEASERGLVGLRETLVPLSFGDAPSYARAIGFLGSCATPFYAALGRGAAHAAGEYGGKEFACVLGQEMSGYATGEVFFAAQALNFRHSHLDNLCYCYDYEHFERDPQAAVRVLIDDERRRTLVNCMVGCMFGRKIYTTDVFATCLGEVGLGDIAQDLRGAATRVQRLRWRTRAATGYDPRTVRIPKRFGKVVTARGPVDPVYMEAVRSAYASAILELCAPEAASGDIAAKTLGGVSR